jgi:hypothetical protein
MIVRTLPLLLTLLLYIQAPNRHGTCIEALLPVTRIAQSGG